jgi:fructose-bisphosphate aldolase, class II
MLNKCVGSYNVEHITVYVRAVESRRSLIIILFFPVTLRQLVYAARAAADSATVPISLHVDHVQSLEQIMETAKELPVESIIVELSHYSDEENVEKTRVLIEFCHQYGKAVEAERG